MRVFYIDDLQEWHDINPITIGTSDLAAEVVASIGVADDAGPCARIDIHQRVRYSCFREVRWVHGRVYIGYGEELFVVDIDRRQVASHALDGYFCHLYSADDLGASILPCAVLATSASEVLAFSPNGELIWKQAKLGIDGVLIHEAADKLLRGAGQWDPPGGWRDFTQLLDTGETVAAADQLSAPGA